MFGNEYLLKVLNEVDPKTAATLSSSKLETDISRFGSFSYNR